MQMGHGQDWWILSSQQPRTLLLSWLPDASLCLCGTSQSGERVTGYTLAVYYSQAKSLATMITMVYKYLTFATDLYSHVMFQSLLTGYRKNVCIWFPVGKLAAKIEEPATVVDTGKPTGASQVKIVELWATVPK